MRSSVVIQSRPPLSFRAAGEESRGNVFLFYSKVEISPCVRFAHLVEMTTEGRLVEMTPKG